jgi:hypothetical protein
VVSVLNIGRMVIIFNSPVHKIVGAAEGCDLLILKKTQTNYRSLRQLLQEASG